MGFFSIFTYTSQAQASSQNGETIATIIQSTQTSVQVNETSVSKDTAIVTQTDVEEHRILEDRTQPVARKQRFSLHALRFLKRSKDTGDVRASPKSQRQDLSHSVPSTKQKASRSVKRAQKSALAVRSLIIGPTSTAAPRVTIALAQPELSKVKSQLIKPKTANKVIAQLRHLPPQGDLQHNSHCSKGPIHAVCLEHTELEEDALHFSKLKPCDDDAIANAAGISLPGVASASFDRLSEVLTQVRVVDLLKAPGFGLGQPVDGDGLLAGALPTAGTVLNGAKRITPELMNLGYATGLFFAPDHSEVYPPTDRMSVLTYWWGLELVLPPPSLEYLSNAQNITSAIMNFLSALSLVNNGVREILPFVRYISQFIDFEFNAIKRQDRGQGVVCAATWIMPAAMVPRPWDFPTPPAAAQPDTSDRPTKESRPISTPPTDATPPAKRPVSSPLDVISNQPVLQLPV